MSQVFNIIKIPYTSKTSKKVRGSMEYFIIPYKIKDKYLLYFSRKGLVALVDKTFVERIESEDKVVKEMFGLASRQKTVLLEELPNPACSLVLELTKDCNLHCTYCYARGGDDPRYMKWKTAKTAIDYSIERCNSDEFTLFFHGGGEPLLAFELIKKCYTYAKKKCKLNNIKLLTSLGTNGTLITKDKINWLKKLDNISLSFDALQQVQNEQRPFKDGSPSYSIVKNTISLLNKHKVSYNINSVVLRDSVPNMLDMIKHLHELGVKSCSFSSANEWGRCTKNKLVPDKKFKKEFFKCTQFAKKHGMNLLMSSLNTPFSTTLSNISCIACGSGTIVTFDGNLSSCPTVLDKKEPTSKIFFYGNIKDGAVTIHKEKLDLLRKRTVKNIPKCKECWAKYMCRGGCPRTCLEENGSIFKPSTSMCSFLKESYYKPALVSWVERNILKH